MYPYTKTNNSKQAIPLIEIREISTEQLFQGSSVSDKILFMIEGELSGQIGKTNNIAIPSGCILFLPTGCEYCLKTSSTARFMLIRLLEQVRFCESELVDSLSKKTSDLKKIIHTKVQEQMSLLYMNSAIHIYINSLEYSFNKELICPYYFETKIKELFHLLKAHYSQQQLARFFKDALNPDSLFSHFIVSNWHKYNSLSQLSEALNMSISGFEKRFKRVFESSPAKWINTQKAQRIKLAIRSEQTPLKELGMRFGFATKSTFNDFCKRNLGNTPGEIRKESKYG